MKTWLALSLVLAATCPALAQQDIATTEAGEYQLISGEISGDAFADYRITAQQGQIMSVDLQSSGAPAYFNITAEGAPSAIFIGSTEGDVADIQAPADGAYLIRVYQMRASARRDETATFSLGISVTAPDGADGQSGEPDYWAVTGITAGSLLNMRQGPDTRYEIVGQLERGSLLQNRGCRQTGDTVWCDVRETGTGLAGWVAQQFLTETAAPPAPAVDENSPIGIGIPFDATGAVTCNVPADGPEASCPFGVIRQGPGNAGVWVTLPGQRQQQLLFEGGALVTGSPAEDFTAEKQADTYVIIFGPNRFVVPEAVINGG